MARARALEAGTAEELYPRSLNTFDPEPDGVERCPPGYGFVRWKTARPSENRLSR